jgi:hydroxymethylbilane synthase
LAIECRVDDMDTEHRLGALNDPATRISVAAERAVLVGLGSPCSSPIGALAEVVEDLDDDDKIIESLSLRAVAATPDGALVRASITGKTTEAESLGRALAAELLDLGAESLPAAGRPAHRWIGSS